jgi:HK97 family phage portal protein
MNWFKGLFSKAASVVSKAFSFMPKWARYAFSKVSIDKLIREGYKTNSAVSACATTLQLTFPEAPLLAGYEEDGRFIPDYKHPVMALLKQPNPDMGLAEFLQFAITYSPIGGNCYIWKQRLVNRKIIALWPFSDVNIQPIAGHDTSEGFVANYEYDSGDGNKIPVPKDDIIHWKWMIDPAQPWKGIGAIELSAREVDRDNEATAYIYALLKNNAVPPVVITLEEGDESTQEQIDAMGLKWIQKHGQGQPAFISSGMKVQEMGFDLHKLAAETLADVPETRIAANFHVPPSVAGLNVGIKRSDYGDTAARKAFTEQTLMALWRSLASELSNGLKDEYPGTAANFALQFDLRRIGALQEQKKDQWERVTLAFNRSFLTRSEAKQELGIKPLPGDEVYFISLASEFVPVGESVVRSDQSAVSSDQQGSGKAFTTKEHKGMSTVGRGLQRIRKDVAMRMEQAVDVYFSQLADRVVERAGKAWEDFTTKDTKSTKELPSAGSLLNADDRKKLETLVKRFYVQILELSWNMWNFALGVEKAFDLTDPLVTRLLEMAGTRVRDIHDTTLQAVRDALKHGNDNGWSIDQLVRGDENQPGLREIVDEVYKGRARTIARTELGEAQNAATVSRYKEAGVGNVEIFDNGNDDDDAECQDADGQIWSLSYFSSHLLEHPNCSRTSAPVFDDVKPDRS